MNQPRIARDALGTLTKLGQGGQGIVYRAPNVKTKFSDTMVFKEYKPHARTEVDFAALAAMPALVEDTLSYHDGRQLVSIAAWPCALVETNTGPVGFVMPTIPAAFFIDLTTVKGVSRTAAEFQHLLNPASVLASRGITITDTQRYQLLREVAAAMSLLHRTGVCIGDLSPKNLLFSLQPHPAVHFIDCDAMRVHGVSALPQMETPDWDVPAGEELATTQSDTYKLGLLALRLLTGDQHTRDVHALPSTTPTLLRKLITDALTNEPDRRPRPTAWTYLLGRVVEQAQLRTPVPRPTRPPVSAPIRPPEPRPVVRSRPAATRFTAGPVAAPAPAVTQAPTSRTRKAVWAAVAVVAFVVVVVLMAVANASGALSSQSTSDVGSSRSTTRTSTALTTPPTISASPPKTTTSPAKTTATTPQPTPAATALSPNHYGIVYIRTASGRTTCMISAEQVACQANQSTWPTNGVAISTDGSTTYKDGDFGNIAHQIQTIGYQRYTAVGWTIAASSTGTRFTNDRTGHGAFVSVEQVQNF